MKRPRRQLQRRLVLVFGGFTMLVASVFGLYAMVFMYAVEDAFFGTMLRNEAVAQLRHHREHGRWATPADAAVQRYDTPAAFPDDLRRARLDEPWRNEFAGDEGRHYHLLEVTARK